MEQNAKSVNEWSGTKEQKLWGLMQIWAEVKYNFAFFDRLPDLDWDAEVRKCIPRVMAVNDIVSYYQILRELVSLLNDGHTVVMLPGHIRAGYDSPPLELQMIEGKIVIVRVGDSDEIRDQKISPGLEIIEIDHCQVQEYFHENVLRFYRGGTEQWGNAFGLFNLLQGTSGSIVSMLLKDIHSETRLVRLTRNSEVSGGKTFKHRILDYDPIIEARMIGEFAYFRLSTFDDAQIVDQFNKELDKMDLDAIKGMILDVRYNIGGESDIGFGIISRLIDKPLEASKWKTRKYLPAYRAWGNAEGWYESAMSAIQPSSTKQYTGSLIVLTGHHTFSSAEDFLVPLSYSNRATLVGEKTAGSTGQPLRIILPGGGYCLICTIQSTFPDGREFIGYGIEPNIVIHPTQNDICENRDPVLERAVEELTNRI